MHTSYFLWLKKTFGFEEPPDILHCIAYPHTAYLKHPINQYLQRRFEIKQQIITNPNTSLKIRSEIIKLLMNSSYGYCLLDYNSQRCLSYTYISKKRFNKQRNIGYLVANSDYVRVQNNKKQEFQYCAMEIGSTILWYSKVIFFDALYFILKCADPRKLQYIYSDTDSLHVIISENSLSQCILPEKEDFFEQNKDNYFGDHHIAGVLILEMEGTTGNYKSEKCYKIDTLQKLKSVPRICHDLAKFNETFHFTAIKIHPVLGMSTQVQRKQLNLLLIPRKRYFVNEGRLSFPLEL